MANAASSQLPNVHHGAPTVAGVRLGQGKLDLVLGLRKQISKNQSFCLSPPCHVGGMDLPWGRQQAVRVPRPARR